MTTLSLFKKKLLAEGAWVISGKVMVALGTLVGVRLLTEFIPKEVYGTVSLLIGVMTLGNNLFAAPLLSATQRFHSEMSLSGRVPHLRRTIIGMLKWATGIFICIVLLGGLVYRQFHQTSYLIFLM